MITPIDAIHLTIAHASLVPLEAHYHLADLPMPHHRSVIDEANFHIIDRTIGNAQIGFDYYDNIVTYRV